MMFKGDNTKMKKLISLIGQHKYYFPQISQVILSDIRHHNFLNVHTYTGLCWKIYLYFCTGSFICNMLDWYVPQPRESIFYLLCQNSMITSQNSMITWPILKGICFKPCRGVVVKESIIDFRFCSHVNTIVKSFI